MKSSIIFLVLFLGIVVSCDFNKDLRDPNQLPDGAGDPDAYLNEIQLDFADFFNAASGITQQLMRMQAMTGGYRYSSAIQAQTLDPTWTLAYQRVLANADRLIVQSTQLGLNAHIGVAKILKAYTYLTLVDLFGDVPKSEALQGSANFNPAPQDGATIYADAITLLEEAKVSLGKSGALTRDIYYDGSKTNWTTLANTILLKAWVNLSMIPGRSAEANTKIDELLASDLIDTEEENFAYKYGTASVPAGSRHPLYDQYYQPSEGAATGYIANYFLYQLYNGRGVQDPRWRYYFFRQFDFLGNMPIDWDLGAIGCPKANPPATYANYTSYYCVFNPGFYGRDHGDGSGTPPDSGVITCVGVYPAGGRIDDGNDPDFEELTQRGQGANGAGIEPIWMSFFTDYLKAEIEARRSNVANAKTNLLTAIQNSIDQVRNFSNSRGQFLPDGLEPSTTDYLDKVSTDFDAATRKSDVIGQEFYVALWGNGIEAYNLYRRTSAPRNLPPTLQANPGPFYRSIVYPSVYVNLNSSSGGQKDVTKPVFWDTNPDNLN